MRMTTEIKCPSEQMRSWMPWCCLVIHQSPSESFLNLQNRFKEHIHCLKSSRDNSIEWTDWVLVNFQRYTGSFLSLVANIVVYFWSYQREWSRAGSQMYKRRRSHDKHEFTEWDRNFEGGSTYRRWLLCYCRNARVPTSLSFLEHLWRKESGW